MLARDRLAEHVVGDEHVVALGLLDGEGLGVDAVEATRTARGWRRRCTPDVGEEVGERHALPRHVRDPPAGDALEVAGQRGLRQPVPQVGEVERDGPVDGAVDGEPVRRRRCGRAGARDGVDPEPTGRRAGTRTGRSGRSTVSGRSARSMRCLHLRAPQDPGAAEGEHAQQGPTTDRPVLRREGLLGRRAPHPPRRGYGDDGRAADGAADYRSLSSLR